MKTGLGLNFLRIVNEEGFDGWAQVYARIPFDEKEIEQKGALFGAICSPDLSDWTTKESEVMTWVDEYFNNNNDGFNLSEIVNYLGDKYSNLASLWLWISLLPGGKREIRMIKSGGVGVILWRNDGKINMGAMMTDNKVLRGQVLPKDTMTIWAGEMGEYFEKNEGVDSQEMVIKVGDELMKNNRAGASLIFAFDEIVSSVLDIEEESESVIVENKKVEESPVEIVEPEPLKRGELRTGYGQVNVENEIVSDRYVGKVGPKEKLINWWKNNTVRSRSGISVGRPINKRRKMAVGLGLLFLILLLVSIVTGSIKIKADNEAKKWEAFSQPIEKKRQEAIGLSGVNLVGARKLMEEVKNEFDAGKGEFLNGSYKDELAELESKINNTWSTASGEKQSTLESQLNIDLIRTGFVTKKMSWMTGNKFLILDDQMGLIVTADGTSKDIKVIAGKGENQGWLDIVYDGKRSLLLDGVGINTLDPAKRIGTFDAAVGKAICLGVFGTNVYVLDQGNKEIYRYGMSGESLGDRVRWLKQGQSLSGNPVDMAIDGDIWILEENNVIERYRRGSKENFSLNGVPEGAKFVRVAVDQSDQKVALLDTKNASVLVFKKADGAFVEQLRNDALREGSDLEFDSEGNIWVAIKGLVWKIR